MSDQSLPSFGELAAFADTHANVRAEIERVKSEVTDMKWFIEGGWEEDRREVCRVFDHPDPDYPSFESFLRALLEELLVFDALAFKLVRDQRGRLAQLSLLSGRTVRPVLDVYGHTPSPPAVAYEQYLSTVSRTDFLGSIPDGADGADDVHPTWSYTTDQLLYCVQAARRWTVYGFPMTERCIMVPERFVLDTTTVLDFMKKVFDHVIHEVMVYSDLSWEWSSTSPTGTDTAA